MTRPPRGWPARSARARSWRATRPCARSWSGTGYRPRICWCWDPGRYDPLGSALVVATAAVRAMFGSRLATVYAPQTVASFGTGAARIDVRVIAPDGAAAYRTALAADLRARRAAGLQLLADPRVSAPASARSQLAAGSVDERLLMTLAALAGAEPVRIIAFADDGPGSSSGAPLRTAELAAPESAAQAMLAFLRAQRPPYLPARADLSRGPAGQWTVTMRSHRPQPPGPAVRPGRDLPQTPRAGGLDAGPTAAASSAATTRPANSPLGARLPQSRIRALCLSPRAHPCLLPSAPPRAARPPEWPRERSANPCPFGYCSRS